MRIRRIASVANWRYAIGEILLIVIGVSIALAATSLYEQRLDRRDEIQILEQLHQTLTEDLQEIERTWEITRNRERDIVSLLAYLESPRPYEPDMTPNFQALFGWRTVRLTKAPFETLKSQSYKAISNIELRYKLIAFYEDHFAKLEYNSLLDRDLAIEKIQPYFFDNFVLSISVATDVDLGAQNWTPKDYDRIKSDAYVANLSRFRADILRRFVLRDYEVATTSMRQILDTIDLELSSGK